MPKVPTQFVVTASRTDDGAPVYLAASGEFSRVLAEARVFADEASADEAAGGARAREREVCDPYVMKVSGSAAGAPAPVSARERIRSQGPTTRLRRPDPITPAA